MTGSEFHRSSTSSSAGRSPEQDGSSLKCPPRCPSRSECCESSASGSALWQPGACGLKPTAFPTSPICFPATSNSPLLPAQAWPHQGPCGLARPSSPASLLWSGLFSTARAVSEGPCCECGLPSLRNLPWLPIASSKTTDGPHPSGSQAFTHFYTRRLPHLQRIPSLVLAAQLLLPVRAQELPPR